MPVISKALEGHHATLLTFGQSGSGKSYSMEGSSSDLGMITLCVRHIFQTINQSSQYVTVRVAYFEVHNEEINDLLGNPSDPASSNLKIVSEEGIVWYSVV